MNSFHWSDNAGDDRGVALKLSAVMAVYNGESFLREAIESVLNQSFADFEFLIVDDASTDGTAPILERYRSVDSRVVVLRNDRNLGVNPSLNRALDQARGDAIARQDADDISSADRFAVQLEALESAPDVSLVIGAFETFQADGRGATGIVRPPAWQPRLEWELLFTNAVGAGGHVMFPRLVRGTHVRYAAKRRYAEDYGLWCELVRVGRVVCPAPVLYRHRRHPGAIGNRARDQQDDCFSEIQQEYQALYLESGAPVEAVRELSRFWAFDGTLPPLNLRDLESAVNRLRHGFLDYVERRYGARDRSLLGAELEDAYVERLGYWLARSIMSPDPGAVRDLIRLAGRKRRLIGASRKALRHAGGAAFRRLGHRKAGRNRRAP